jgi:uncharacterized hydrophobic protein (TIGR00341 family)
MALRLIEVFVPQGEIGHVPAALEGEEVLGIWTSELTGGQAVARVLLPSNQTETVSDLLSQHFETREGFRLVLLPVEATLPAPDAEAEAEEAAEELAKERPPERVSREELYQDIADAAKVSMVYVVTVALSTLVAAVGLIRGDVAIVIGAMVIAPLLGPNVALSLASTLGDPALARRSLHAIGVGVGTALILSLLLGYVVPVDPQVPELMSRARVDFADVALAAAAGSAGCLAYTSGLPTAIVGVMVAVALLPPLVATGLLAGAGYPSLALGALMLLITNVTCVNLAGVVTFLAQKVRPRTWWDSERAKKATRLAITSWLAMLAVLLFVILFAWG